MLPGLTSAIFVDRPSTDFCDGPGAVVSAAIFQDNGRFVDEEGYQTYVYLNDQGLGKRGKDAVLQTAAEPRGQMKFRALCCPFRFERFRK